jgi:sugar porter (SP) family MFS transporter
MSKVFYWSLVAALAGFLFGFDTVVISGADQKLQQLWQSTNAFHGAVVMAMALWGTVVGAFIGSFPTQKWGRKKTLWIIGIFYSISALGSALVNDPYAFAAFRFLGGLGVGVSTIATPAYISEIAPPKSRGKLVGLYQFNIVFGILMAFLSNYFLSNIGDNAWRWMLGVEAIPALLFTILVSKIPQSPRWLLLKGENAAAQAIWETLNVNEKEQKAFIEQALDQESNGTADLFSKKYRFPLWLTFFIAFFNQFSGINAFLYYAPRIFEEGGLGESTALLSSVGIGIVNLIFTLIGINLIDRLGRKKLMYFGSFGYIISLSLVACAFIFAWEGILIPIFLFLFIASHALGQGAVIWVFISEIFPNHLRNGGQAFGSSIHWILAAAIPSFIPILFASIGAGAVFLIFTAMMVLQLLFVHFMMPETKGVPLEQLSEQLTIKE